MGESGMLEDAVEDGAPVSLRLCWLGLEVGDPESSTLAAVELASTRLLGRLSASDSPANIKTFRRINMRSNPAFREEGLFRFGNGE